MQWWAEIALLLALYIVYTLVRNLFGSATIDPERAYQNAERVIDIERDLGMFWELSIQGWFINQEIFISF